jgi:predicted PurR-regulated permease PerM
MDEKELSKFAVPIAIFALAVISFFMIKPLFTPIILALFVAYLLLPVYNGLNKRIKSRQICAGVIILAILLCIITPSLFLLPTLLKDLLDFYLSLKEFDIYSLVGKIYQPMLESKTVGAEIIAASNQLKTYFSNFILSVVKNSVLNVVSIIFGILIFLFTLFFSFVESNKFAEYFSILFPFPKYYRDKFYNKFNKITNSLIYGQIVVGILQGLVAGIGYYVLGLDNAFLLTLLTLIVGIIPIIGPWLVWMPLDLILFVEGNTGQALSLFLYGMLVINLVDTLIGPKVVAKKAEMNSAIALIGVIGGIYFFGPIIGFFLGPLVLGYLILLIEIYLDKKTESIVLKKEEPITSA